jgi:polyhydroxyalkanoate synthesis regulator phasin
MTIPNIGSLGTIAPLLIQEYERYLPNAFDESMTILEKMNKIIQSLNQTGDLVNNVVEQWNEVMAWVVADGINTKVVERLDQMVADGTMNTIINQDLFNSLNTKVTDLENKETANEESISNVTLSVDNLQSDVTTNTNTLNDLSETVQTNTSSIAGLNTKFTSHESNLQSRMLNVKYPPIGLSAAKMDGVTDDSDSLNAMATYLGQQGGGFLYFPQGICVLAKTLFLPDAVSIQGAGTYATQLAPTNTFTGSFLIESKNDSNTNTHHQIRDIFLNMGGNNQVGGIWLHKPYDYTALTNVVGNRCNNTFIKIGDLNGGGPSQTVKLDSCIAYGWTNRVNPLLDVQYAQECLYINNKFLGTAQDNTPLATFDCVTQQTLIGNSFAATSSTALKFKVSKGSYRLSGNRIQDTLFESCSGTYAIEMIGLSGSWEGDSNVIMGNRYYSSSVKVYIDGMVNTIVIDSIQDLVMGSGARRTMYLTPMHYPSAVNTTGNMILAFDGNDMRLPVNGAGIVLESPDGTKAVKLSIDNTGTLITRSV